MDKTKTQTLDWICFLNEYNEQQQMFVDLICVDSFMVKFYTREGTKTMIPSCRILKIKERKEEGK